MTYLLTEFRTNSLPLTAVYESGAGTYTATPVIGFGIFRDMDPANRGAANILVPLTSDDFEDGQTLSHSTKADVLESHAPYQLSTDPDLFDSVRQGWTSVSLEANTGLFVAVGSN